jgi:hypothetical protein
MDTMYFLLGAMSRNLNLLRDSQHSDHGGLGTGNSWWPLAFRQPLGMQPVLLLSAFIFYCPADCSLEQPYYQPPKKSP